MSITLIKVALMAPLAVIAQSSWASEPLPTSENPARGEWRRMKPSSFAVDMASVLAQCNRAAGVSSTDRLTTDMCQQLPALIQGGKCKTNQVQDGIVFDHMNGHESGMSRVTRNVKKALGRTDRALICDLGNRTFAYWFTGEKGKSCNNVGIVFTAPPRVQPPPPPPTRVEAPPPPPIVAPAPAARVQPPPPQQCGWVSERYIVTQPGQFVYVPGLSVAVCNGHVPIPDIFVSIPDNVMTVTRPKWVCQPASN